MSQRQLAARSGISHATISRILGEHREPNLGTAMKLAGVLMELDGERGAEQYVGLISALRGASPTTRVERALRADTVLDDLTVRRVMDYYLAVREVPAKSRERSA